MRVMCSFQRFESQAVAKFAEKPSSIFDSTHNGKVRCKCAKMSPADHAALRITLDTNVVLDWLVFRNPTVLPLVASIEQGRVQWVACASMRAELARTLTYDNLARWAPDREQALATFDAHALLLPEPATLPALRCSDPDDQVFLDLAAEADCRWLLTHDRALLRLARRARSLGVAVIQPRLWVAP
jgi:predicted nucleic acid-binding protein